MIKLSCQVQPQAFTVMGSQRLPIDKDGALYWHMYNFSEDLDPIHQLGTIHAVLKDWERLFFPWEFRATANPEKASIHIHVAKGNHIRFPGGKIIPSPFDFASNPDTLAVQWPYHEGFKQSGWMIINDDHEFGLENADKELRKVLHHEFGHFFRLGHTNVSNDIMAPFYNPKAVVTQDTIDGIFAIHGDHIKEFIQVLPRSKRFLQLFGEKLTEDAQKENKGCLSILGL